MRTIILAVFVGFAVVGLFSPLIASDQDDAQAMVKKAVALFKSLGKEKALSVINDRKGPYLKGDVYLSACNLRGVMVASPVSYQLIGMDLTKHRDADGKFFMKEVVERASRDGSGVIEYKWTHPTTKKVALKVAYFEKVGDVIVSAGAYKK